jgi:predicted ATPase/DNA-binding CsgD family transcriptional regulator
MQKTKQDQNAAADTVSAVSNGGATTPAASKPHTAESPQGLSLTKREQDVLELLAFGLTNKEIAQRLALGRRTVEWHIDHVLGKLNAPTRTRAVIEAERLGLLGAMPTAAAGSALDAPPNNLPFQLSSLLGREQDLADLSSLLEGNRLVTLSGAGGVGKTRLALRVGVDLLYLYPNGVWFCDFSPISDAVLAASVVAKVVRVREHADRGLAHSIAHALKRKHALIILDNCEHVLDAVAELVDEILHSCPNIRILATSRQPLGIIGEVVLRVRSLAVPDTTAGLKADTAMRSGAVALFVDRAQASDVRFSLTNENAPVVATICCRLDGIPLAIELAATRVNVVNVHSLAQSLDDRFKVLTAGSRTALPRHKTLEALIDWSYDRLSPQEQKLFARLSIFGGGFNLQAATSVCAGNGLDDIDILARLSSLVDKSLVVAQTGGEQERYRLLESTRAYALGKLSNSGELEWLTRRHAEYFRDRAQAADEGFGLGSAAVWLAREELDLENYRAALVWALTDGNDVVLGAGIAGALERLWFTGGLALEARGWIGAALHYINESEHPAVAARLWRAKARFLQGQPMRDSAERALVLCQSVGDDRGAAYALRSLSYSLLQMGKLDEANDVIDRAISAMRDQGDMVGTASCLSLRGLNAYNRGDFAAGRNFYQQALSAYKALGYELGTAEVLGNLGELEFADGHAEDALNAVNESLAITSRGKEVANLAIDHNNRAAYRIALNDLDHALESAREGLRWAQPEQNAWNTSVALQHLALLAVLRGQAQRAALLVGYVNVQYRALALEREATEKWGYEKLMAVLHERQSQAEIDRLAAEGAEWSEDQAVEEALKI